MGRVTIRNLIIEQLGLITKTQTNIWMDRTFVPISKEISKCPTLSDTTTVETKDKKKKKKFGQNKNPRLDSKIENCFSSSRAKGV